METRAEALGLSKKINSFKFLFCLIIWHDILDLINITSKYLQSPSVNIGDCVKELEKMHDFLGEMRSHEAFETLYSQAKGKAELFNIEPEFVDERPRRLRRLHRRLVDDDEMDQQSIDLLVSFEENFYYAVIDKLIESIDERFELMESHCSLFEFLYDLSLMKDKGKNEIQKSCNELQVALTDGDSTDIDANELCTEIVWI